MAEYEKPVSNCCEDTLESKFRSVGIDAVAAAARFSPPLRNKTAPKLTNLHTAIGGFDTD